MSWQANYYLRDDTLDAIADYLQKSEADSKKKKPQGVRLPNKIKKIGNSETYRISTLGYGFLKSIGEA